MDEIIAACINYDGGIAESDEFPISTVPVWILGKKYSTETQLEELKEDVRTKLWMTYRRNFDPIGESGYTSDKGWGCMLRCGQMVLAEAILRLQLGRDWRWHQSTKNETYLKIVSMFEDFPDSPFSIHQIAQHGVSDGKEVGEWYGPNAIAHVLKKIVALDQWNNLSIYVAMDNAFIMDEIKMSCQENKLWKPLLIFIPLRLGVSELNQIYISGLKKCIQMPQTLGLIGGKPNHALYFIGHLGDEAIYLDPHVTQDCGSLGNKTADSEREHDNTYHCMNSQRMPFQHLSPTMSLCFMCTSEKDFDDLCNRLRHEIVDTEKTPLLELYQTRPSFLVDDGSEGAVGIELEDHLFESEDDEDFEVLG